MHILKQISDEVSDDEEAALEPGFTNIDLQPQEMSRITRLLRQFVDVTACSKPLNRQTLMRRLTVNLPHFLPVYAAFGIVVALLITLSSPLVFTGVCLLALSWAGYSFRGSQHLRIRGRIILPNELLWLQCLFSVSVLIVFGLIELFLAVAGATVLIAGLHSSFRQPVALDEIEN